MTSYASCCSDITASLAALHPLYDVLHFSNPPCLWLATQPPRQQHPIIPDQLINVHIPTSGPSLCISNHPSPVPGRLDLYIIVPFTKQDSSSIYSSPHRGAVGETAAVVDTLRPPVSRGKPGQAAQPCRRLPVRGQQETADHQPTPARNPSSLQQQW